MREPVRGTDRAKSAIHNYDDRSDRYVIPHEELFLGHFGSWRASAARSITLTAEVVLGNFEERVEPL